MAMNVGSGGDEGEVMVDINTTPLIDVMLVMLVMFIITIPPPTHSVDVTLPGIKPAPAEVRDENRITIDTSDVIRWNDETVDLAQLGRGQRHQRQFQRGFDRAGGLGRCRAGQREHQRKGQRRRPGDPACSRHLLLLSNSPAA